MWGNVCGRIDYLKLLEIGPCHVSTVTTRELLAPPFMLGTNSHGELW